MNGKVPLPIEQKSAKDPYQDPKRYLWLFSPGLPVIGLAAVTGYVLAPKKLRFLAAAGPAIIHGLIPVLEKIIGEDGGNVPDEAIKALEQDPYYMQLVAAFIPLQYLTTLVAAYAVSRKGTPLIDQIMMGATLGAVNGTAVGTAHELCHKPQKKYHHLSHMALAPSCYTHFRVEHPFGHHKHVATPEDAASAQLGESFWRFLPRSVIGSVKSAIQIESARLARKGKGWWSMENELLQGWAMSTAFHASLIALFGRRVIPFQITQAVYSVTLFEAINYVEHYGLLRQKLPNGQYERTMPQHSWNNNSLITNLLLYQIQRHSDHHAYPTRPFQTLRHYNNIPELPGGYAGLLLPTIIPVWWFKLMDQRVVDHYQGDLSKANIYPKARARIFAKFGKKDSLALESQ
ncbi:MULTISPECIES: alkane 1-monooxygenase [Acinetobacter]|uniref:alkane 1-monooxygenase n=1 Tax=Acinetobacter TaxID=469 RepID=UPI0005C78816|nr:MULTISPECIES: alkane 1-monooxygenase [Acinetobacter]